MHPGEWVMMPIAFTNAISLKRSEKFYIHKFQSQLNKEIYAKSRQWNHAHRRQESRPKKTGPRRRKGPAAQHATNNTRRLVDTTYKLESQSEFCSPSLNTVPLRGADAIESSAPGTPAAWSQPSGSGLAPRWPLSSTALPKTKQARP